MAKQTILGSKLQTWANPWQEVADLPQPYIDIGIQPLTLELDPKQCARTTALKKKNYQTKNQLRKYEEILAVQRV